MTCSCSNEPIYCKEDIRPRRVIHSQKKSSYWQIRQKTGAIEAILQPCCSEILRNKDSFVSICGAIPDGVQKTTSKIKFGNETSSRYHKNCVNIRPRIKCTRNPIKKNVITEICPSSPCAKKKEKKFKNECYCIKPSNKPRIPGAPEYTIQAPDEETFIKQCDDSSLAYRPETLQLAKDIIDYIPQSTFLSRIYRENCKKCMCNACVLRAAGTNLKFTERRMNLENAYHKLSECNRINFDKLSELNCVNLSAINISPKSSTESTQITCSHHSETTISDDDCCVRRSCSRNITTDEKIDAVKAIRKNNFFDTHSTCIFPEVDVDPIEHKCIFKYTIDDRGLLKPLNPDCYGTNRCSICNKAQPEERPECKITKEDKGSQKSTKKVKVPKKVSIPPKPVKPKVPQKNNEVIVPYMPLKNPKPVKAPQILCPQNDNNLNVGSKNNRQCKEPSQYTPACKNSDMQKVCNPAANKTVQLNIKNPLSCEKNISNNTPKYITPTNTWALRFQKGCSA